jgi:hypothetical protein
MTAMSTTNGLDLNFVLPIEISDTSVAYCRIPSVRRSTNMNILIYIADSSKDENYK